MDTQRLDVNSMYGGSNDKSPKSNTSPPKSTKKTNSYNPSDDNDTSTSVSKLMKANRLLEQELDETKSKLKKEQLKTSKLEKIIKVNHIKF